MEALPNFACSNRSQTRVRPEGVPNDPRAAPLPAALAHHPGAALFPLLEVESPGFGELVADIRTHGLMQPIVLHQARAEYVEVTKAAGGEVSTDAPVRRDPVGDIDPTQLPT